VQDTRHKPIKIFQLNKDDMKNYHVKADLFRFDCIPYAKVKALQYALSGEHPTIKYKLSFADDWTEIISNAHAEVLQTLQC